MADCLADDTIARLVEGQLAADERAAVLAHIDGCAPCRALIADVARDGAEAPLPRGAIVGRYVVVDLIGAGAMGVVYAAWDPQLQRRVALKLLRPEREDARLLREAQTMARLQHPNVVAVHDVGAIDERVFVAMELVEGDTLAGWLNARPRTWREIVAIFVQIGEGLAAAHDAGLVHRDFKPDNVLVGADGRARVGDFGLAYAEPTDAVGAPTQTHALVGTPAYMAPEQLAGEAADARSDQFAYCTALFEALYGARPFAAGELAELRAAIVAGPRLSTSARVPARVKRIVLRGLEADPAKRFASMRALVGELARAPRTRVAAVATLAAATAIAATGFAMHRDAVPACDGADVAWGDTWDGSARAAVQAAFAHTGRAAAAFAFGHVDQTLSAYRASWVAAERGVCEATRVRGVQAEAVMASRMQCLDDRRREAGALARVLGAADADVVDNVGKTLATLGPIDACSALRADDTITGDLATRVRRAAIRGELADAAALEAAGRYASGLALARAGVAAAHALGDRGLEAELLYRRGHLEQQADTGTAEATLQEAATLAIAARDDGAAADAWIYLTYLDGFDAGRRSDGERWASYAEAAIERLGGDDLREAARLQYLAGLYLNEERYAEAGAALDRAAAAVARAGDPETPSFKTETGRGMLALQTGRIGDAYAIYHRLRERAERTSGPDNPGLITQLCNEAVALVLLDRAGEAVPLYQRALALSASIARPAPFTLFSFARALRQLHQPADSLADDRAAVAIYDRRSPPLGWISEALTGEGDDLLDLGRPRDAIAPLERALALRSTPDADPEDRAKTSLELARALWDGGGDRTRARTLAEAARTTLAPIAAKYGAFHADALADADRWLAAHR